MSRADRSATAGWALLAAVVVLVPAIGAWNGRRHGPDACAAAFAGAMNRGDTAALVALTGPTEREGMNLTSANIGDAFARAAGTRGVPRLRLLHSVEVTNDPNGGVHGMRADVADASGRTLTRANIVVYNTDSGWRASPSLLLHDICATRSPVTRVTYTSLCQRLGVPARAYNPIRDGWFPILKPRTAAQTAQQNGTKGARK